MENIVNEPAPKYSYVSQETYLEMERAALEKHEYYQGEVFAMSGASLNHNRISVNTLTGLSNKLKGKPCQPLGSDMRVHIPQNTLYTYPDITVVCGEPELLDDSFDNLLNPSVIIEILSKTTRKYDAGPKFKLYRDISTLKEYILIDSLSVFVEQHFKNQNNIWELHDYKNVADNFASPVLNISFSLNDIYEGIIFA
jgi:Uma2 family endonuclease